MPGTAKSCIALLLIICLLAPALLTSCKKDGMNLFYESPPGEEADASDTPAANTPSASASSATPATTGTTATPGQTTATTGGTTATASQPAETTPAAPAAATTATSTTTTTTTTAEPTPEAPPPIGLVVAEASISAANGGTFAADDGSMTLVIPPGALPEDTFIQVRQAVPGEIPAPDSVFPVGPIYDFLPDGLVLKQPATITYRLSAEAFAGLPLGPGQQPVCLPVTRSGDGTWETLDGPSLDIDATTGDLELTAEMMHFCTPIILAMPINVEINPLQLELDPGQPWSTGITITNWHSILAAELQDIDFNVSPPLSASDDGGDLRGLYQVPPDQVVTFLQDGRNWMESPGPGQFDTEITINFAGDPYLRDFFGLENWSQPPARLVENPLPPDFFRPQVTETGTIWTTDTPGRVTFKRIWSASLFSPGDGPEVDVDPDTGELVVPDPAPAPTTTSSSTTSFQTRLNFWQFIMLLTLTSNAALFVRIRNAFTCRAVVGGILPCFAPDTLVLMADGTAERIAAIQPGEAVASWDEAAGQYATGTVAGTGGGQADFYYLVNGGLRVTPPHPFYVVDRGWTKVPDLRAGDLVLGPDGPVAVTSIELISEAQPIANISVSGYGNYFVSADGAAFFLVKEGP